MNARIVVRVNAVVILTLGVALVIPLVLSLLYADGYWASFLFPGAAMILAGTARMMVTQASSDRASGYVSNRDIYLSVTLAWVLAAVLGGVPFLVEGTFVSPLDSTFEAMSGFTTTGATLLSDIEAETPSILFWRSLTQWLGGIGIVVLFVAVAPAIGFGAARLLGGEVSGLTQTRFTPRIADTAKALLVYLPGAHPGGSPRPAPGRDGSLRRGGPHFHYRRDRRLQPQDCFHRLLRLRRHRGGNHGLYGALRGLFLALLPALHQTAPGRGA